MAADHPPIDELFRKYLANRCNSRELEALLTHFGLAVDSPELKRLVDDALQYTRFTSAESIQIDRVIQRNEATILALPDGTLRAWPEIGTVSAGKPVRGIRRWLPYAAAVAVLALAVGTWLAISHQPSAVSLAAEEILPGGNRATLTLADGRVIDLSEEQEGIVIKDGITYLDGSEVYETGDRLPAGRQGRPDTGYHGQDNRTPEGKLRSDDFGLLTLSTPKGGQYQITLPDGSNVWLNANSTLKYPSRFSDRERTVQLQGEAFFEIRNMKYEIREEAADKNRISNLVSRISAGNVPFRVVSGGQVVEVLGTQFNISAYTDDPTTQTTLVEGRVRVVETDSHQAPVTLAPGQQATLGTAGLSVHQADVEQAIDWKNGKFTFNQMEIRAAMTRIARWYDVEVTYQGDLGGIYFGGSVSRANTLRQTLDILESTGNMKFEIQGRRVVVMP